MGAALLLVMYHIAIGWLSRTNFPLGSHLANEVMLDGSRLPGNAQEYAKELTEPDGTKLLYAHFLDPRSSPGFSQTDSKG